MKTKNNKMKKLVTTGILVTVAGIVLADNEAGEKQCVIHPAPTNLIATGREADVMHLQWTPGDNSGVAFDIYRSSDGGVTYEHINQGYAKGHYYDTYELSPLTTYVYRVRVHSDNPSCKERQQFSNLTAGATTATEPDAK
jgi:hypothetical protein